MRIFADGLTERIMAKNIISIQSVCEYNNLLGLETLHPLVSVIDLSQARPMRHALHTFGFYALFLKDVKCGDMRYGRQYYDYQEGTLMCLAPGQVAGIEDNGEVFQPKGWALVFHPDLIRGTSLGRNMKMYSFFSYEANEALHLSEQERTLVVESLNNIATEIRHGIDRHTKMLITSNIELLLNYCIRFYDRQFITREHVNQDKLTEFERLINEYYNSEHPQQKGLLTVAGCAELLHLSPNYFGDMVKKETGRSPQEHLQQKLMDIAKEKLLIPGKTVSEVSYELGFQYPQHFTRMFKRNIGCTPNEYRLFN